MNSHWKRILEVASIAGALALAACSSSDDTKPTTPASAGDAGPQADAGGGGTGDGGGGGGTAGDPQTPPTGKAEAIDAWLKAGNYKGAGWACEPAPHAARSPSPHGQNRICSNAKGSAHGAGEYPIGAAHVKEIYDSAGANIVGFAIEHKVAAGKGEAWYWFERTDADGVVANGLGVAGTEKSVCVGCHAGAGSDAAHSGHDFVYTQVK